MKLYLVESDAPRREHIDTLIISAETPEQAFQQWDGFYGYPWPCHMNEVPSIGTESKVLPWNPPIRFTEGGGDGVIVEAPILKPWVAPRAGSRRSGATAPGYGHPDFGKRRCACNDFDCGWKGTVEQLGCEFEQIPDLNQRCAPGEIVPVGECPKCHALAQLTYSE